MTLANSESVGNGDALADLLAQYLPDAVMALDGGMVCWTSPNAEAVLGWPAGDLTGEALDDLVHPDDRQAVRTGRDSAAGGDEVALTARFRRRDGSHAPMEILLRRRNDDLGPPGDMVAITRRLDGSAMGRGLVAAMEMAPRGLAERAGDMFFVVDGNGAIREVGAVVQQLLGWGPDEVLGMHPSDLVHPDDLPALQEYRRAVQADTARGSLEIRARTRGRSYRWVRATALMVADGGHAHPEATRVVVSWRDIDELVRKTWFAEREGARLRQVLDTAMDPFLMLTPVRDAHGEVTDFIIEDANEGAAEYLRWTRAGLIGMRLLDEFPNVATQGLMAAYIDALESETPVVLHDLPYPHEVFGETRIYEVRAAATDGSLIVTWRDTTPSSLAQEALARSESMFRGIAQSAGDAVVAVQDGRVAWASPRALLLGLEVGADFEVVMTGQVVPDSMAGVRDCCLLMGAGRGYAGRWHRAGAPPVIVRSTTMAAEETTVVAMIEEDWRDSTAPGGAPGA